MLTMIAAFAVNAILAGGAPVTDPWGSPTTEYSYPPLFYKMEMITPFYKVNSTGVTLYYGGSNPGYAIPGPKYHLTRTVAVNTDTKNGWPEPSWTPDYATVGDFSVDVFASPDPVGVTIVPDGSTYYHNVWIKKVVSIQMFGGYYPQGTHIAARGRSWQTKHFEAPYVSDHGNRSADPIP